MSTPTNVWLEKSLEFGDMVERAKVRILGEGAVLLVVEGSILSSRETHVYCSTRCLELLSGEVVYHVTNVDTSAHDACYRRLICRT